MANKSSESEKQIHRLDTRPGELIDRQHPIHFSFDGKLYSGFAGDTISSALWANGVCMIGRSFKYHRPRGDFSMDGTDPNALVQVGSEPNVRAGTTLIKEGMEVLPQNVFPSLQFDLLSANSALQRFMPVGFYYKAFHSKRWWPFYEKMLRKAAGLGHIGNDHSNGHYDKQFKHPDVLVVGAGPSGLSAALFAANAGARVLLIERHSFLGGHLRYLPIESDSVDNNELTQELTLQVKQHELIETLVGTTVMGAYDGHWFLAYSDHRLYKIRAKAAVIATGVLDQMPIFDHNDLPGILTGSAAARLTNLYGVCPGHKIVVASANDEGLGLALALRRIGCEVLVAEEREQTSKALTDDLEQAGIFPYWHHTIGSAKGKRRVQEAALLSLESIGAKPVQFADRITCDAIAVCTGSTPNAALLYQSHVKFAWNEQQQTILPNAFSQGVFAAGRVCGTHGVEAECLEGQIIGQQAAHQIGFGEGSTQDNMGHLAELKEQTHHTSTKFFSIPGNSSFRFVDFAEDVTEKDVHQAIAEGYDSIELLKRYSTISMGPDQGRFSSMNSVRLTAFIKDQSVDATGTTTSRPPTFPVKMGTMAGRLWMPVRRTPMHHWHEHYGCRWIDAGHWKRPDTYHNHLPEQEVHVVRNNVGIVDVSTLGKIRLYGKDVPELLSRLYTNKWRRLPIGSVRYGLMCNEAGILMDDGVTARLGEHDFYMSTTSAHSQTLPESIHWWLQQPDWNLDVHLVNLTTEYAAINVAGPHARDLMSRLTDDIDLSNDAFPFMGVRQGLLAGVEAILMRIGYTGELSYEIHIPAGYGEHVWQALMDEGQDLGVMPFGMEAMGILRLEKGHIIIGHDTDGLSSPLETELVWAVKLDKEDFLGKFALQRKANQAPKQALVGFEMKEKIAPKEGHLVVSEEQGSLTRIGWVSSARFSPTLNKAIGLAWVPDSHHEIGTELTMRIEKRLHRARVVSLPFYDPEGSRQRS